VCASVWHDNSAAKAFYGRIGLCIFYGRTGLCIILALRVVVAERHTPAIDRVCQSFCLYLTLTYFKLPWGERNKDVNRTGGMMFFRGKYRVGVKVVSWEVTHGVGWTVVGGGGNPWMRRRETIEQRILLCAWCRACPTLKDVALGGGGRGGVRWWRHIFSHWEMGPSGCSERPSFSFGGFLSPANICFKEWWKNWR
jgi:hypothetical protein